MSQAAEVVEMKVSAQPGPSQRVRIVDVTVPFGSIFVLVLKTSIASVFVAVITGALWVALAFGAMMALAALGASVGPPT